MSGEPVNIQLTGERADDFRQYQNHLASEHREAVPSEVVVALAIEDALNYERESTTGTEEDD